MSLENSPPRNFALLSFITGGTEGSQGYLVPKNDAELHEQIQDLWSKPNVAEDP